MEDEMNLSYILHICLAKLSSEFYIYTYIFKTDSNINVKYIFEPGLCVIFISTYPI